MVTPLSCATCEAPLARKPGPGRNPKFCSAQCRHRSRKPGARSVAGAGRGSKTTTEAAKNAALTRWSSVGAAERAAVATALAAARWAGHEAAVRPSRVDRACRFCGEVVPMTRVQQSCGAADCRRLRNNERLREFNRSWKDSTGRPFKARYYDQVNAAAREAGYTEDKRRRDAARRALKAGATVERFENVEVFERDDWTCGICSLPVDREALWPDPSSVSLDHIVPLSKGGDHSRANTRCSHLGCNIRRGNRSTI